MKWERDYRLRPERLRHQQARLGRAAGTIQWLQDWINYGYARVLWRYWKAKDASGCTSFARTLAWRRP